MVQNRNRLNVIVALQDRFSKGLKSAQTRFQSFTKSITSLGAVTTGILGAAFITAGAQVIRFANNLARSSRDAEAAARKFEVVFEGVDRATTEWAENFGNTFGLATSEVQKFTGQIGDLLIPFGHTRDAAFDMTEAIAGVTGAIAIFDGSNPKQVFEDMLAALAGSSEVLTKYGINVKDGALQNLLLAEGLDKVNLAGDDVTRTLLLTKTALEASADAIQNLDEGLLLTQVRMNRASAEMEEAGERIGTIWDAVIGAGAKGVLLLASLADRYGHLFPHANRQLSEHVDLTNRYADAALRSINANQPLTEAERERSKALDAVILPLIRVDKLFNEHIETLRKSQAEIRRQAEARRAAAQAARDAENAAKDLEIAQNNLNRAVEQSSEKQEDLTEARERGVKTERSYAKQLREVREEQERASQSVPERLARELLEIQKEREGLFTDTSISRNERKRQLDVIVAREEAVARIMKAQGISQADLVNARRRENRTQVEKDIEQILRRRIDLEEREKEIIERSNEAKIDGLKRERGILRDILKLKQQAVELEARGAVRPAGGRSFNPGAPSFGALGLRDIRSERQQI